MLLSTFSVYLEKNPFKSKTYEEVFFRSTQTFFLLSLFLISKAQVGIGTNTPNSNTVLDVASTSKAILIPRLTTIQRDAIIPAAEGMLIFNKTDGKFQGYAISSTTNVANSSVGLTDTYVDVNDYPAQTFQVSEAASTYNISFWVDKFYNSYTTGNITFELRQGVPNGSSTLLYTENMTINTLGQKMVNISNVNLSTGTTYYFLLKPLSAYAAGWFSISRSNGATPGEHSGGSLYYNMKMGNDDNWMASQIDDLKFEIKKLISGWVNLH